ncbi:hypothetical protein OIU77_008399 [Salix suchowensis]|uniref:Uncharacterized protein n=1 Tax=Salix suchowensis TaxID=1278906 RepID=A0ABQ9AK99_9ROSI|nr:hypothetical protein OIU77_008399 [Salix suchowensis]
MRSKSLATMKHFDPSMSKVEDHKKESEEKGVLLVTEKDLKGANIDTDAKVTDFDTLVTISHTAYKNFKQKKGAKKQKDDAISGDEKIGWLVKEIALKKLIDYVEFKMKERFVGEKLLSSAIKS